MYGFTSVDGWVAGRMLIGSLRHRGANYRFSAPCGGLSQIKIWSGRMTDRQAVSPLNGCQAAGQRDSAADLA